MADLIQVWPGIIELNDREGVVRTIASVRHPSMKGERVPPTGMAIPHDSFTRKRIREGGLSTTQIDYGSLLTAEAEPAPAPAIMEVRTTDGATMRSTDNGATWIRTAEAPVVAEVPAVVAEVPAEPAPEAEVVTVIDAVTNEVIAKRTRTRSEGSHPADPRE
jgi:hypothetical protein